MALPKLTHEQKIHSSSNYPWSGRQSMKYTQEQINEWQDLRKQGHSYQVIAKQCHSSISTVRNYTKDIDISDKIVYKKKYTQEQTNKWCDLRKQGHTYKAISENLDIPIPISTIKSYTDDISINAKQTKTFKRTEFRQLVIKDIKTQRLNGISVAELAKQYDISISTVYKYLEGTKPKKKQKFSQEDIDLMIHMKQHDCMSTADIACHFNVLTRVIYPYLAGIKPSQEALQRRELKILSLWNYGHHPISIAKQCSLSLAKVVAVINKNNHYYDDNGCYHEIYPKYNSREKAIAAARNLLEAGIGTPEEIAETCGMTLKEIEKQL